MHTICQMTIAIDGAARQTKPPAPPPVMSPAARTSVSSGGSAGGGSDSDSGGIGNGGGGSDNGSSSGDVTFAIVITSDEPRDGTGGSVMQWNAGSGSETDETTTTSGPDD